MEFKAALKAFNTKPAGVEVKLLSDGINASLIMGLAEMLNAQESSGAYLTVRIEAPIVQQPLPFGPEDGIGAQRGGTRDARDDDGSVGEDGKAEDEPADAEADEDDAPREQPARATFF